jgi:hypothetical protein
LRIARLLFLVAGLVAGSHDARAAEAGRRLSIVVHRGGGRVLAGHHDDARRFVSFTLKTTGRSEVTMPAFEGTEAEWRGMLSCARSQYSGLPIDLVETPPANGEYLLVMVGGSPRNMGKTNMWGWASTGDFAVVRRGVGFVFSAEHRVKDRAIALCETLTHELGHMIGLQHSTDCNEVMDARAACTNRDYAHGRLRGFHEANRLALESSLAAWAKHADVRDAQITNAASQAPTTPKSVAPRKRRTAP